MNVWPGGVISDKDSGGVVEVDDGGGRISWFVHDKVWGICCVLNSSEFVPICIIFTF